ncbi:hypothetical protein C8Q76DRAFT_719705 [Earliella scabrosa]|nr:hypothetical protein C8Q76DRAFT_719705 [Earliella scabrosa]
MLLAAPYIALTVSSGALLVRLRSPFVDMVGSARAIRTRLNVLPPPIERMRCSGRPWVYRNERQVANNTYSH